MVQIYIFFKSVYNRQALGRHDKNLEYLTLGKGMTSLWWHGVVNSFLSVVPSIFLVSELTHEKLFIHRVIFIVETRETWHSRVPTLRNVYPWVRFYDLECFWH